MFSHGLAETDDGKKVIGVGGCEGGVGGGGGGGAKMEIGLPIISSEIFGAILEFIYTGQITLHEDNVQDILTYADMYQVERLLPPCEQFLLTQLHPSNALGIFLFAETHSLTNLRSQAQAFLHHHFLQVLSSVVSWILHDAVTRRRFAFEVIRP